MSIKSNNGVFLSIVLVLYICTVSKFAHSNEHSYIVILSNGFAFLTDKPLLVAMPALVVTRELHSDLSSILLIT